MSIESDCPSCSIGRHEGHNPDHGVKPGLIGGTYCNCSGDCSTRWAIRMDKIGKTLIIGKLTERDER